MKKIMLKKLCAFCLCAFVPFRRAPVPFRRGFTLIELLVVIVVISILTGITLPVAKYVTRRARLAQQQIYIEKIKSALEDYRVAYGEYPITPSTNSSPPYDVLNRSDVLRHYPENYLTECYYTSNSPYTSVSMVSNTLEIISDDENNNRYIDYCLTYPLMLRQINEGVRPFMDFKKEVIAYLVYRPNLAQDQYEFKRYRKTAGGNVVQRTILAIYGNPISRYKAIDPVSQKQWLYSSIDGVTYSLTNNPSY